LNKIEFKDKIDNSLYSVFNLLSNVQFKIMRKKNKEYLNRNLIFKGRHQGERCFILGTGPSLKGVNPDLLSNEITFGLNFLNRSEIMEHIVPTYYCFFDNSFYEQHINETISIIEKNNKTTFFLRHKAKEIVENYNLKNKNIYYQYCNLYQHGNYIRVDMTRNMTAPFNVVVGCIQTAIYMGFKEIFLLGVDFTTFASSKEEHCYDKGTSPQRKISLGKDLKFYSIVCSQHYALEQYAIENGIKIYNLSENSLLDAYEKRNINDLDL